MEKLVSESVAALVEQLGWKGEFSSTPLHGGANNQVFRLSSGGQQIVLKVYFQHPGDTRDRMGSEFEFATMAWNNGVRALPKPLLKDAKVKLALFDYVKGNPIQPVDVQPALIKQAVQFFENINHCRSTDEAGYLPLASEAFFSIREHVEGVQRRMQALTELAVDSDVDRQAERFIVGELMTAWQFASASLKGFQSDVQPPDRCLSPSDFGFHNALRADDGTITFLDFEYAGWDDPAKTICDFFCQPKVPIAMEFFDEVASGFAVIATEPESVLARAQRLLPLYQVKWCCILLNEFLPVDQKRRHFSGVGLDRENHKMEQLRKAKLALNKMINGGRN